MSHLKSLENQLRSWTPRAPSPSLKARLFGERSTGNTQAPSPTPAVAWRQAPAFGPAAWHWLAPAMAVFVLGVFVFGNHPVAMEQFNSEVAPRLLAAAALTQPDLASHYACRQHSDNNSLRNTFEWTNDSHSLRTAPSMAQTNSFMQ